MDDLFLLSMCRPKPRLNIWQWADANRYLAKGISNKSQHGAARYCSADVPHQRGIQESFTDPEVQITVFIGASQIAGKTEILQNVMGYFMQHKPMNQVVMYSTIESAEKFSKVRLNPNLHASPCLDGILAPDKSRTSGNTILVKHFLGGSIFIVSSNSTAALRGATGAVLLGDEVDDYEADIGGQGDPIELLWKRGENFPNVVKGLFSTPTIEGQSRIWSYFDQSDKQFWFMPCPHCGKEIIFKWSHASKIDNSIPCAIMQYEKENPSQARLVCQECFNPIDDRQRLDMYRGGRWKPSAAVSGIRGFHLNWLYCPWPAHKGYQNRLHEFAEEWERAKKKGTNALKVMINTGLAECFAETYEKPPDTDGLLLRCEPYPEIPDPVIYLTCFVDVQSDRLEYEIVGWGIEEESWGIATGKLFGDPQVPATWKPLDELLLKVHDHPSGAKMRINCTLIDSGGVHDARAFAVPVYRYVKGRQSRYIFASKGSSLLGAPPVVGHYQKNGINLQNIGTDNCKSTVYARLEIQTPGPEYCHFPQGRGYDEEWFKQLTAERVCISKGKRSWVKRRTRNEALDMRAGNIAAFLVRRPNLKAIRESLLGAVAPPAAAADMAKEKSAKAIIPALRPRRSQIRMKALGF